MGTKIKEESGIKALFMSFINPSSEELMKVEEIMKSNNISEKEKEILLKSLKENENFEMKFFKDYTSVRKPKKEDIPKVKLNETKVLKEKQQTKDIDERSK